MAALGTDVPTEGDLREAIQKLDPLLGELFTAEKERIVKLPVEKVVVGRDGLLIRLRLNGLNSLVAKLQGDAQVQSADRRLDLGRGGQTASIRVPMELKRRNGRKDRPATGRRHDRRC
jgi:hypothetical protein